ncbi:hypothetical protein [Microbulbifer aggregans]|uniref:DUF7931 domain-containing protein n=1 Tax=Microbulbifer aggregans TaxID=1769779 RepID=UPI001CFF543E|nr:hypothetical protein [Microbulbifer aggregans]
MREADTELQSFTGPEGCATALRQLIQNAKRHVRIASQRLEHAIYHDPHTVQVLSDFARRSRYSRVEILVTDTQSMHQRSHRLIPLIQRLSSYIQLRCLQENNVLTAQEYALGDDQQILLVTDTEQWRGVYEPYNRQRARKLDDQFSRDWIHACEDPNLRQLQL